MYQFSSFAQSCVTPWDPMDCSTPGFPVLHQLPELAQTHILQVSEAIQPSHPLSSPSHPPVSLSQHQDLLWVSSLYQVYQSIGVSASALILQMNIQGWFPWGWTGWISLQSRGSKESSPTPQFKSSNSSVLNFLYGPTLTSKHDYWKNHSFH